MKVVIILSLIFLPHAVMPDDIPLPNVVGDIIKNVVNCKKGEIKCHGLLLPKCCKEGCAREKDGDSKEEFKCYEDVLLFKRDH